jgi:two-component system nitrate/nitrite response regulator NarL
MTRVIIADDHPFMCEGVKAVLTQGGVDVVATVGDGDAALEAIERYNPDVVILDVRMPGRDGISVLEHMREIGDHRPVILLAAIIEDSQLLAAMRAEVSGIVLKQGGESQLARALDIVQKGGQAIPSELIGRALDHSGKPDQASLLDSLNPRERQIAEAVAKGQRNREIAEAFGATVGSIKIALYRIYEKLGVNSRTELTLLMMRRNP